MTGKVVSALLLAAWLPLVGVAASSAEVVSGVSPVIVDWTRRVIARQPEQKLLQGYAQLAQKTREAGGNVLGNLGVNLRHENYRISDDRGLVTWEGGVDLPLKVFRQKRVFAELADRYPDLERAHADWLRWQAAAIARALYDDLLERRIRRDRAREAHRQSQRLFSVVRTRVETGDASRLDLVLAQRNLSRARRKLVEAEGELEQTIKVAGLWGIDVDDSTLAELVVPEAPSLAETEVRVDEHPQHRWQQQRAAVALARGSIDLWSQRSSTELYLGSKHDALPGGPSDTALLVELRVPLGNNPDYQRAVAERDRERREREAALATTDRELRRKLVEAREALLRWQALLPLAREQYQAARKALELSVQSWQAGEIGLQELLIVQQQENDARLQLGLVRAGLSRRIHAFQQAAGIFP